VRTIPNVTARCVPNPLRDVWPFSERRRIVIFSSMAYTGANRDAHAAGNTRTSCPIYFFIFLFFIFLLFSEQKAFFGAELFNAP
jgi:dolichol kinase